MLGRPSAAEIVQVTNFVGPMSGLSEVISRTCGGVRMNSRREAATMATTATQELQESFLSAICRSQESEPYTLAAAEADVLGTVGNA